MIAACSLGGANPISFQAIEAGGGPFRDYPTANEPRDVVGGIDDPDFTSVCGEDQAARAPTQDSRHTISTPAHVRPPSRLPTRKDIPDIARRLAVARNSPCPLHGSRPRIVRGEREMNHAEPVEHLS